MDAQVIWRSSTFPRPAGKELHIGTAFGQKARPNDFGKQVQEVIVDFDSAELGTKQVLGLSDQVSASSILVNQRLKTPVSVRMDPRTKNSVNKGVWGSHKQG